MSTFLKTARFNGTNGTHFHIDLYYTLTQSTANNTSTITYDLWFVSTDGYSASGSNYNGYINGVWVGSGNSIGANKQILVGSKKETITHNEDGTKTVNYSGSLNTSWDIGSASLSGSLTLPKIDRYPQILTAPDFTDEENPTITYSTIMGFENATLYGCISADGTTETISYRELDVEEGQYTFNLTSTERNALRTASSSDTTLLVTFKLKTVANNENYFSNLQKTMTIVNATPTLTYTSTEQNTKVISMIGNNSATKVIANASQLLFSYTPSLKKSATFKNIIVSEGIVGNTYQSFTINSTPYTKTITVSNLTNSGKFIHALTDSRNLSVTIEDNQRTLLNYEAVRILTYNFKRQNSTSSNVVLNAEFNYWGNVGTYTNTPIVKYKLDSGNWVTIPSSNYSINTTTHKLTITNYTITNILPYTSQGQFSISIEDALTSQIDSSDNGKVLKGIPTFDYGEHDLKVNGDLYVADTAGANAVNVLTQINNSKTKIETYINYSTSEKVIGEWTDGKPIYRKVISIGNLPSSGAKNTAHNISNLDKVIRIYGFAYTTSYKFPLPYTTNANQSNIALYAGNNNVVVEVGQNRSGFTAYAIIEYTKSTD